MNPKTRRRREIESLLSQRESRGLSLRALSERSGIPVGTLSWWSHKLRTEESAESVSSFVEVVAVEPPSDATSDEVREAPDLQLRHPSGVVLEFRGELAERVAERVVTGLKRWS